MIVTSHSKVTEANLSMVSIGTELEHFWSRYQSRTTSPEFPTHFCIRMGFRVFSLMSDLGPAKTHESLYQVDGHS